MKILLSNHALNRYGGSETWTRTMYNELSKNHDVDVYTPTKNTIYLEMPPFDPTATYDLGILNHAMCLTALKNRNIKRIIYTSHGVIPGAERPVQGADVYVAVSEEVQARLKRDGFESTVIRNPIDTEQFKIQRPIKSKLKTVAYISNNPHTKVGLIRAAAKGLSVSVTGREQQRRDVRPLINNADLVIGLGRTCYESMAMGRNVIAFDYKGADGFVTPETVMGYRTSNCSGRYNNMNWTVKNLQEELELYDPTLGPALRDYIVENNNVTTIAQEYLSL